MWGHAPGAHSESLSVVAGLSARDAADAKVLAAEAEASTLETVARGQARELAARADRGPEGRFFGSLPQLARGGPGGPGGPYRATGAHRGHGTRWLPRGRRNAGRGDGDGRNDGGGRSGSGRNEWCDDGGFRYGGGRSKGCDGGGDGGGIGVSQAASAIR